VGGAQTIGPSAKAINGNIWVNNAFVPHVAPKEATKDDIRRVVEDFRKGAERAKKAGFDGLQLHGANGYIIDQFLRTKTNERTDEYGGSIENRSRLCLEVLDQLVAVFGAHRVGIKLSPVNDYNDMADEDPIGLVDYLVKKLNEKDIAFVELTEGFSLEGRDTQLRKAFYKDRAEKSFREIFKPRFKNTWVTNYGFT
jgi:N-ethylmaleimide reductase